MRWYNKWKTQKGQGIEVTKIKFLTYFKKWKNYRYTFYDEETKMRYCCEIWLCQLPDGTRKALKFREPFEDNEESHVGWSFNKYPIVDRSVNYHFDTLQEIKLGRLLETNPGLERWEKEQNKIDRELKRDKSKISQARLRFRNSPSKKTWNDLCGRREEKKLSNL